MNKATPGPWTAVDRSDSISVFGPDKRRCVARVQRKFGCAADARLIAAAPDLMDALREAYRTLLDERVRWHLIKRADVDRAREMARAALAKAGE